MHAYIMKLIYIESTIDLAKVRRSNRTVLLHISYNHCSRILYYMKNHYRLYPQCDAILFDCNVKQPSNVTIHLLTPSSRILAALCSLRCLVTALIKKGSYARTGRERFGYCTVTVSFIVKITS